MKPLGFLVGGCPTNWVGKPSARQRGECSCAKMVKPGDQRHTELFYWVSVTLAVEVGALLLGFCRMQQILTKASWGVTLPPVQLQVSEATWPECLSQSCKCTPAVPALCRTLTTKPHFSVLSALEGVYAGVAQCRDDGN